MRKMIFLVIAIFSVNILWAAPKDLPEDSPTPDSVVDTEETDSFGNPSYEDDRRDSWSSGGDATTWDVPSSGLFRVSDNGVSDENLKDILNPVTPSLSMVLGFKALQNLVFSKEITEGALERAAQEAQVQLPVALLSGMGLYTTWKVIEYYGKNALKSRPLLVFSSRLPVVSATASVALVATSVAQAAEDFYQSNRFKGRSYIPSMAVDLCEKPLDSLLLQYPSLKDRKAVLEVACVNRKVGDFMAALNHQNCQGQQDSKEWKRFCQLTKGL
ncbi:MAG: hypothetical protein D6797_09485 [Bdellovibrio sp.]|nr:MAG: hypothetical protein D6797_09485 [Bdellovibrio sp.]